jgi:uncharacterized cupredoxin-like copper-binding protein
VGTATVPTPTTSPPTTTTVAGTTTTTAIPPGAQIVQVAMNEFTFKLSQSSVKVGAVAFEVVNQGQIAHNFALPSSGASTPNVDPGGSATLVVTFTNAGSVAYVCTLPQHADAGMEGTLAVMG